MAVLVTGGYGHIGSWVCHDFIKRGKKVIISGRSQHSLSYLEGLEDSIQFFRADVLDYASTFRMFKQFEDDIEGIIHVAGLMGGPHFATNPHNNIRINTFGTVDMLEAARIFGIKKFVYISSGSVYGKRDDVPDENTPVAPSDVYGAAKTSAEFFGLQYANEFGLDFRVVRVFFAYGPGHLPSQLYPLYQAVFGCLEGRLMVKMDAGADQQVDFTYVKDISQAIRLVFDAPTTKHRIYNCCSGWYATLPELVKITSRYAPGPVQAEFGPGRLMPRGPSLDFARISQELGYKPQYTFEQGVQEYAQWIEREQKRRGLK